MRKSRGAMLAAGGLAALVALAQTQGCGDDDSSGTGSGAVAVAGNVADVVGPTIVQAPAGLPRFAFWDVFGPSSAVAQGACTADDVLICLDDGTTETCAPVNETSCEFSASADADGSLSVFFVKDDNANGEPDPSEAAADLTNDLGDICEGLTVTLVDVEIDFDAATATAASVDRDPQNCPTPTPTGTPDESPTATPTNGTPAPTATPTEAPTPTPTP